MIFVDVEELKRHIHKELFGARFPEAKDSFDPLKEIMSRKERQKERIMLRAVEIMQRHEQKAEEILAMLQEKFFLSEDQAREILRQSGAPESN